ncbi:MAG: iron-sulfur cluster assembly protein, partial [Pseudomonadota bacterium]
MADEQIILNALKTVQDPELHQDLVSLGMVKDINLSGDTTHIVIELTTPACPLKGKIEADIKTALAAVGVTGVTLEFTAQVRGSKQNDSLPGVQNVIAVGSGKGGVG